MPLPDLIEIVPLDKPVRAEITIPGSKSITNRALVLAALAEGEVTLHGALWSEDTQVMVECLQELGFMVNVAPDPDEICNRTITVYGQGGNVPGGGTLENPLELFVGNAGTAARFLAAMVCLGQGVYRLHGVPRMHERPQAALFQALRDLGYRIDSPNDKLPALIHGGGPRPDKCRVSIQESSQFASALLLCAKVGGWDVDVIGENMEESPYVAMTSELIKVFPHGGGEFRIEPDASSGSYFWAVNWMLWIDEQDDEFEGIQVRNWPTSDWQIDANYPKYLDGTLSRPEAFSRSFHLGDSIMTEIVSASLNRPPGGGVAATPIVFTDLGRLRVQECDRVVALREGLEACHANVTESGDTLTIIPNRHLYCDTVINTYNDHRMAMCFAILGLKVPGIRIKNPACVKKTFPNFFQKLATSPPRGLGATILDGNTGRKLGVEELFAD